MVSSSRPWSAVREVRETQDLWVLRTEPAGIIGLPKRALTSEQATELRGFLVQRGLARA
ncbi:MAG: hypothetical protein GEV03_16245 [Streptosporangiales bacterium]|nr:hypothetical protein [Streptosporangiales bacterium]